MITFNNNKIDLPENHRLRTVGVKGDHKTTTIQFSLPRLHGDIDLYAYSARIEITPIDPDSEVYYHILEKEIIDEDDDTSDITLNWVVDARDTADAGKLYFSISFVKPDNNEFLIHRTAKDYVIIDDGTVMGDEAGDIPPPEWEVAFDSIKEKLDEATALLEDALDLPANLENSETLAKLGEDDDGRLTFDGQAIEGGGVMSFDTVDDLPTDGSIFIAYVAEGGLLYEFLTEFDTWAPLYFYGAPIEASDATIGTRGEGEYGINTLTVGSGNVASGDNSAAFGENCEALDARSIAAGYGVTANKGDQVIFGRYGETSADTVFAVAHGTDASHKKLIVDIKDGKADFTMPINAPLFLEGADVSPTTLTPKFYVDALVGNALHYCDVWDASGGAYPTYGDGSGDDGAIRTGDLFVISVAGALAGGAVQVGDMIIWKIGSLGDEAPPETYQDPFNWNTLNTNISYVPEDTANKETSMTSSNTKYPTSQAVLTALGSYVPTSRTINGQALSGNVTLKASDIVSDIISYSGTLTTNTVYSASFNSASNPTFSFPTPSSTGIDNFIRIYADITGALDPTWGDNVVFFGGTEPTWATGQWIIQAIWHNAASKWGVGAVKVG